MQSCRPDEVVNQRSEQLEHGSKRLQADLPCAGGGRCSSCVQAGWRRSRLWMNARQIRAPAQRIATRLVRGCEFKTGLRGQQRQLALGLQMCAAGGRQCLRDAGGTMGLSWRAISKRLPAGGARSARRAKRFAKAAAV